VHTLQLVLLLRCCGSQQVLSQSIAGLLLLLCRCGHRDVLLLLAMQEGLVLGVVQVLLCEM
jgi:hypothetical protein